jgi:hypothetical protein
LHVTCLYRTYLCRSWRFEGNAYVFDVDKFERFDRNAGLVTPRIFSVNVTQVDVTRFDCVDSHRRRHGNVLTNAALLKGRAEKET